MFPLLVCPALWEQGPHLPCSLLYPQSLGQGLGAKPILGEYINARQLRRLAARIVSLGVRNANQGASQCFGNIKPSMTQLNARVQVLCDSMLCFKHEASLCSGFLEHQWGHCGMTVGKPRDVWPSDGKWPSDEKPSKKKKYTYIKICCLEKQLILSRWCICPSLWQSD